MARIAFSSTMEEINGKLSGSVFQDSYLGLQIRTRVSPRNPQTNFQQLRRGEFGYISASYRFLSPSDKFSWDDFAGTIPGGKRLFISSNVNLSLINEATVTEYIPSTTPPEMPIEIDYWVGNNLQIIASDTLQIVPAGLKLLIFATNEKDPPKNFINPSNYSPIVSFDSGTDLSVPTSISADWIARFGLFTLAKRICIKSVLIDKSNGNRGADFINCAIEAFIATTNLINADGDFLINANGDFLISP